MSITGENADDRLRSGTKLALTIGEVLATPEE